MVTDLIERVLTERELEWETTGPGAYVVSLPGTHKLKTACNLIVGEHALRGRGVRDAPAGREP